VDGILTIYGRGRSPDGSVRARVGGDGYLEAVRLRPEAMRLDSDALAGQVCAAVRSAQQSFALQATGARADILGDAATGDPVALAERLEAAQAGFAQRIEEFGRALDVLNQRLGLE
jgi:DNA-binding protein YbaB